MNRRHWIARAAIAGPAAWLATAGATSAHVHGDAHRKPGASVTPPEQKPWGIAGDARRVQRTIAIDMDDRMRFTPEHITVTQGQTVRLRLRNRGRLMHELVIGTKDELAAHAELMKKHPGMQHDEPYMAHVAPGRRGEIVWTFNRAGEFHFACLIPGHYEAGMTGRITVQPA